MSCIIHGAHDFLDPSYYEFLLSSPEKGLRLLGGKCRVVRWNPEGALFQELPLPA